MIFDEVNMIDIDKKNIKTNNFYFKYDKLILSPGIQLDYSDIEGLYNTENKSIYSAWKAGEETKNLAEEIRKLQNNDNIVVTVPLSPYRCPPGPYERISLIADYIKRNSLKLK